MALSGRELRILGELEERLRSDDPDFVRLFRSHHPVGHAPSAPARLLGLVPSRWRSQAMVFALCAVLALTVVSGTVLPALSPLALVLLGVGLVTVAAALLSAARRLARRSPAVEMPG